MNFASSHSAIFTLCGSLLLTVMSAVTGPASTYANPAQPYSANSPQLPLLFEENRGQFNDNADYVARGKGYTVVLGQRPVIELYRHRTGPGRSQEDFDESPQARMEIEALAKIPLNIQGAREDVAVTPLEQQQALTHYLTGQKSDWKTDIPTSSGSGTTVSWKILTSSITAAKAGWNTTSWCTRVEIPIPSSWNSKARRESALTKMET